MILITHKVNNIVLGIGNEIHYWDNGYPVLTDTKTAFVKDTVEIYEVETIPSEVIPEKYCYTEADGFYINPDWVEPDPTNTYGIPDETYHAIINDLTVEVANNGY